MAEQKFDSMMKKTLKNLCSTHGWCYGVVWGFDQRNSLLLTLKDCYYEEQMGALIDSLLLQAHVVGGGVIGQTAFAKNHQWLNSDAHHEMQNCVGSFDSQEDSEFFSQFSMGIKTIAVISVEPWGVVELGSTHKNPEIKDFVDRVQILFREMDGSSEVEAKGNEPQSNSHLFHSSMQLDSIFHSENLLGVDHSLVLPSTSSNQFEQLLFESANFFDPSASLQDLSSFSDCSVLTASWPNMATLLEDKTSFSGSRDQESCKDSILIDPPFIPSSTPQQLSNEMSIAQNLGSSKDQRFSGLLTVEEFFGQSNFAKAISKSEMENDFSQMISPHDCDDLAALVSSDMRHSNGLIQRSSLSGSSTPPLPTNSLQSSVTHALRSSDNVEKPMVWNKAMIPESDCSSKNKFGSVMSSSNSLFSKLGLDHLLDGVATTSSPSSYERSLFGEDWSSSAAKRRRTGESSWSQNQMKFEGPCFGGKMNPEAKNIEVNSEDSKREARSCIDDSYTLDAAKSSSSRRQEEQVKIKKKKAKPGTKPRPKDRQMIQDRLAELRELIPNGQKMSIDRLLERTIRHLNFMQSLTRHAESLNQVAKPKSIDILKHQSMNGGDGGVTWAYEVGSDAMVCPLIVEDLTTPGQMLIEILCEEHGFFLEIVEIIRGFGLTILKGEMEIRETKKIWGRFVVEAQGTRFVTRHEIFSSLIQLLQMSGQSATNFNSSALNNFQPSAAFPLNFTDSLQCANL